MTTNSGRPEERQFDKISFLRFLPIIRMCFSPYTRFIWRTRDYLQVLRNYYRCGMFEEGDEFEEGFLKAHPELPVDLKTEKEHISTKAYFRRKWEKKR